MYSGKPSLVKIYSQIRRGVNWGKLNTRQKRVPFFVEGRKTLSARQTMEFWRWNNMEQPTDAGMKQPIGTESEIKYEVSKAPWWSVLLEGIIAIIIGLFLLYEPIATTILLIQILAIFWLIEGIIAVIGALISTKDGKWKLLSGILSIVVGIVILMYPIFSPYIVLRFLVIFVGALAIVNGAVILTSGFKDGEWSMGILGSLSLILGLLLLTNSLAGILVLPWVFGIFLIMGGIGTVIWGIKMRTVQKWKIQRS
jgi:uncharacterized membrane protein HdeD (DUF308 family)